MSTAAGSMGGRGAHGLDVWGQNGDKREQADGPAQQVAQCRAKAADNVGMVPSGLRWTKGGMPHTAHLQGCVHKHPPVRPAGAAWMAACRNAGRGHGTEGQPRCRVQLTSCEPKGGRGRSCRSRPPAVGPQTHSTPAVQQGNGVGVLSMLAVKSRPTAAAAAAASRDAAHRYLLGKCL